MSELGPEDEGFPRHAGIASRVVPGGAPGRRWRLEGGVSARVEALEVKAPDGGVRRVVLRCPRGGLSHEHALLDALRPRGIPVPALCFADPTGQLLGSPGFVMEMVDGETTLAPARLPEALEQMADVLARVHALDLGDFAHVPLPQREDPVEGALTYLPARPEHAAARAALEAIGRLEPRNAPTLLHGDFWPGNVLFGEGAIVAVIDWEDAAIGDPLCDLAGARVELAWRYGEAAMETFTEAYARRSALELGDLPVWELYVASAGAAHMGEWGLSPSTERRMRERGARFLARASATLLAR